MIRLIQTIISEHFYHSVPIFHVLYCAASSCSISTSTWQQQKHYYDSSFVSSCIMHWAHSKFGEIFTKKKEYRYRSECPNYSLILRMLYRDTITPVYEESCIHSLRQIHTIQHVERAHHGCYRTITFLQSFSLVEKIIRCLSKSRVPYLTRSMTIGKLRLRIESKLD